MPFKIKKLIDLQPQYLAWLNTPENEKVNLSRWLPKMAQVNPHGFMPGHVVLIIGGPGIGKSAMIQNILWHQKLPTFFFSLEMDEELVFERTIQIAENKTDIEIADDFREGRDIGGLAFKDSENLNFIFEHVNIDDIAPQVLQWEKDNKQKLKIIAVDYLGYLRGGSGSRYEQATYISKQLKELAKATRTVVFALTQIHRPEGDKDIQKVIPTLNSCKDSGDIENNCDYAFCLYEPPTEIKENSICNMHFKILKNRKGPKNVRIECILDYPTLRISQL